MHGNPDDAPVVLLEGMGGDLPGWRRNLPRLARDLFVVAFDHRGNGRSDEPPGPASMATFVEDTFAVMDEVGLASAHLYGQSFGGMVALEAALTHPERVRSIVLAATHAGHRGAMPTPRDPVPKGEPWRSLYAPRFPDEHPEHVAEDLRVGSLAPAHPLGGRRQWEAIQAWDATDRLGEVSVPVLILHGTDDRLIAPANAEMLARCIPAAELVWLEGAGHLYHSEQPESADAAVIGFVLRHS